MTDNEVIEIIAKLYKVKDYCKKREDCCNCPFEKDIGTNCLFCEDPPEKWDITKVVHNMARKEKIM